MSINNEPLEGYNYWDSYPEYPVEDWIRSVQNEDTRVGYWEWVKSGLPDEEKSNDNAMEVYKK